MPGLIHNGTDAFGYITNKIEAVYYKDRSTRLQSEIAARVLYAVFSSIDISHTPPGKYGLEISGKDLRDAKITGV